MEKHEKIKYLKKYLKGLMDFRVVDLHHTKRDDEYLHREAEFIELKIHELENKTLICK